MGYVRISREHYFIVFRDGDGTVIIRCVEVEWEYKGSKNYVSSELVKGGKFDSIEDIAMAAQIQFLDRYKLYHKK